ncbi:DUF4974 domain-containing protein [Maribellus comscasis]|uniref:DUF4974 domain-containing protein n=1 Tax=Maribellus comscasis TaxID=2681766 RepID=A0A6I6K0I6_9BACT|nr:FecR domain-containing protein [Maribellus comscasis]QGY46057.1 DUF4974 domain-containing protein [Maribellus comscasis]
MTEYIRTIYLLKKFIANTSTPEELKETEQLISEGIDDAIWMEVLTEHEKSFSTRQKIPASPKASERLEWIRAQLSGTDRNNRKRHLPFRSIIPWAATIAATVLIAVLFYPQLEHFMKKENPAAVMQLASAGNQSQMVNTPDGSKIWVNNNSTLKYPSEFSSEQREVFLEGEGFFNVKKNPDKPFIVYAGEIKIKVLGTSFDVQSYQEDDEVTVTLATGKVEIAFGSGQSGQNAVLSPGQQLVYNKCSNEFIIKKIDPYASYAWKDGLLVFDQQPLDKITKTLERYYNVSFVFKNEQLANKKVTFRQKNEDITSIMEILSFTAGFSYSVDGKEIIISGKQ